MIHIIYSYFIVAAIVFGYSIGDPFNEDHIIVRLTQAVFWVFPIIKWPFAKLWDFDIVQMTLVHLGFNRLGDNEHVIEIISSLDKYMVPRWQKSWYGRYLISALTKLKKMNDYEKNLEAQSKESEQEEVLDNHEDHIDGTPDEESKGDQD